MPVCCFAQDLIKVTAQIEGDIYEQEPVKGTITVTRDLSQKVDTKSFRIAGNPLTVEFVKNVPLSESIVLTLYDFKLEPQPKGHHILPEISVKVADKAYRTIPTTYSVREKRELPASQTGELLLKLQAFVDGEKTLYPGQTTKLTYRYLFNTNMDMTKEKLPLLDAEGLKKVGVKQFKEKTQGSLNILEITQEVEAVKPGTFTFGPSVIEGRAYKEGRGGQKLYAQQKLSAIAPDVTVTVRPFPENEKPTSFNGAVGNYTFNVTLNSKDNLAVGDKIVLIVRVSGKGQLERVPLPELCCQPGFPGNFRLSDIPPVEKVQNNVKEFVVEMRPLTSKISEIPSVAFSFFNPKSKQYVTLNSKPIPIKVTAIKEEEPLTPVRKQDEKKAPKISTELAPIEIYGNYPLSEDDLKNKLFGVWSVLLIIPVGLILLIYQWNLQKYLDQRKLEGRSKKAKDLFKEALSMGPLSPLFYDTISKAFLLRLKEVGEISDETQSLEKLPETENISIVQELLHEIEERRFSGEEETIDQALLKKIKQIFKSL